MFQLLCLQDGTEKRRNYIPRKGHIFLLAYYNMKRMGGSSVVKWVRDFLHAHDIYSVVKLWYFLELCGFVSETIWIPETRLYTFALYITLRQVDFQDRIFFLALYDNIRTLCEIYFHEENV
jgi:hypothetical protein